MATKKSRQRISYVIEPKASSGHKLGVNGLAVDPDNSILYSGGRDGLICAWNLHLDLKSPPTGVGASAKPKQQSRTTLRSQVQAHTGWVNDIVLAQNNTALVSGSSDLTVKVWRPHSEEEKAGPHIIGEHADFVKRVAAPPADIGAPWVASGGFDRRVNLWDLNGGGKVLSIDTSGDEAGEKGSVYALCAGRNLIANGGPEAAVRLWDPRSGNRVTKFVGHTDTIRSILINDAGDYVLTGSSDRTIKLWSVTAGRCMYTFTMHDSSVWSLYSETPDLGVFYSSDRDGLVVKTDVRGPVDQMDDGLSLAVAHENEMIWNMVACQDHIWTATNRSSINRWGNVTIAAEAKPPEAYRRHHRTSSAASRTAQSPPPNPRASMLPKEISPKSILRISNTAYYPPQPVADESSVPLDSDHKAEAIHRVPEETVEGQFGLLKYKLLNDRRRALTVDTAGDVVLWDLIQCKPIQSFGKRQLVDVLEEINPVEAVAPWCSIDTSSGSITVTLDPFNCFDAEVYADELTLENPGDFREDQRINLGKWIIRYLFAGLIDEEIKRDEAYRQGFNNAIEKRLAVSRAAPPTSIALPDRSMGLLDPTGGLTTPRAHGTNYPLTTPGLAIGLATPYPAGGPNSETATTPMPSSAVPQSTRLSVDKEDYFTVSPVDGGALKLTATTPGQPATEPAAEAKPADADDKDKDKDKEKDKDKDKDKDKGDNGKTPGTPFGKKFLGMAFGSKKLNRSGSTTNPEKPVVTDDNNKPGAADESGESRASHEKEVDDNFWGVVQRIRNEYDKLLAAAPDVALQSGVSPSLPNETPTLHLPRGTKIIIKEETSGESSNVYIGTIESVGRDGDVALIEQKGAMWLGELLLQNQVPLRDPVKVSFVLLPYGGELPQLPSTDSNNRLNANRMLRVRKILAYVAEKLDLDYENPEQVSPDMLRPEEYLELYCNDQLLSNSMSLATLRAHVWKGGTDVVLHYRANGRKELRLRAPGPLIGGEGGAQESAAEDGDALAE